MEIFLGAGDASRPLQWWGYVRANGNVVLKRYVDMKEIKHAAGELDVVHVRGPFIAFGSGAAMAILRDKIATAKVTAAHKRLEAMSPHRGHQRAVPLEGPRLQGLHEDK
jgi:hypothetical protein